MKRLACFFACLMALPVSADWTPPEKPDPEAILEEAKIDRMAGRWPDALAKYVWFHENALKYDASLSFVRLTSAVRGWGDLAEVYRPAGEKLEETRDRAGKAVLEGRDVRESFREFAAINFVLQEEGRTRQLFVTLDMKDPKAAAEVFEIAQAALIEAEEYRLCGKYADPKSFDRHVAQFRRFQENRPGVDPKIAASGRKFGEKYFTNQVATLAALLVVDGRTAEAEEVVKKAEAEWDDANFRAALAEALAGKVPEPLPRRR